MGNTRISHHKATSQRLAEKGPYYQALSISPRKQIQLRDVRRRMWGRWGLGIPFVNSLLNQEHAPHFSGAKQEWTPGWGCPKEVRQRRAQGHLDLGPEICGSPGALRHPSLSVHLYTFLSQLPIQLIQGGWLPHEEPTLHSLHPLQSSYLSGRVERSKHQTLYVPQLLISPTHK